MWEFVRDLRPNSDPLAAVLVAALVVLLLLQAQRWHAMASVEGRTIMDQPGVQHPTPARNKTCITPSACNGQLGQEMWWEDGKGK